MPVKKPSEGFVFLDKSIYITFLQEVFLFSGLLSFFFCFIGNFFNREKAEDEKSGAGNVCQQVKKPNSPGKNAPSKTLIKVTLTYNQTVQLFTSGCFQKMFRTNEQAFFTLKRRRNSFMPNTTGRNFPCC